MRGRLGVLCRSYPGSAAMSKGHLVGVLALPFVVVCCDDVYDFLRAGLNRCGCRVCKCRYSRLVPCPYLKIVVVMLGSLIVANVFFFS